MKFRKSIYIISLLLISLTTCNNPSGKIDDNSLSVDTTGAPYLNETARQLAPVNPASAREYALRALEEAKNDTLNKALAYHLVGMSYFFEGNPPEAIRNYEISMELNKKIGNFSQLSKTHNNLGIIYNETGQNDKSIFHLNQSIQLTRQIGDSIGVARAIGNLGNVYQNQGDYAKTLQVNEASLQLRKLLNDSLGVATTLMNLGIVYKTLGNYEKALGYYFEALEMHEKTKNLRNKSTALYNIGNVYHDWHKTSEAEKYYSSSLEISEKIGFKQGMAFAMNQLGNLAKDLKEYDTALVHYKKALTIFEQINDANGIANIYSDLAVLHRITDDLKLSKLYAGKSLKKYNEIGDKNGEALILNTLSLIEIDLKNFPGALSYALKGEKICLETGNRNSRLSLLQSIGETYLEMGNYEKATKYLLKKVVLKDSIFNDANNKKVADFNTLFEVEKREKEIAVHKSKLAIQDLQLSRQKNVTNLLLVSIAGLVLIIGLFAYFYKQKQKANQLISKQKQEIEAKNIMLVGQNEEISAQRDQLFKQHKEITDSINYARLIQSAMLPSGKVLDDLFDGHFVLFRPRNVVSGDFYWARSIGDNIILVAADCTGHGVPGAFMSVMGISLLNEIVKPAESFDPAKLLSELRSQIKILLHQTNRDEGTRDGMDMAVCIIDKKQKQLKYAGAHISLYMAHNGKITELSADKMTVGVHPRDHVEFTGHCLEIGINDRFYLFSDGFADQFGGVDNRKFKRQNLVDLILNMHDLPFMQQNKELETSFLAWKGSGHQIDDVMIIGFQPKLNDYQA